MNEKSNTRQLVLESVYIEMDPVLEGFEGVLVELSRQGKNYVLSETAAATGNLLLRFTSSRPQEAYRLFQRHTQALRHHGTELTG